MKFLVQLALAATALASAIPNMSDGSPLALAKRAISPDGTCGNKNSGNNKGYTCPTGWTKCCSEWGWCGDGAEHCGTGCQSAFGTCSGGGGGGGGGGTTPPQPSPVPYGQWIYSCTVPGKFALTFDDGPYDFTSNLLNYLSSRGVKATFFVNGQNWGAPITDGSKTALVQRMVNEGHQVGSHTWSHPDLSTLSYSAIQSQMRTLDNALVGIIGKRPTYARPPYFSCNSNCLSALNDYHVMHASLDTNDWQQNAQNSINAVNSALASSNPGSASHLVLMHDVHQNTVNNIVPAVVDAFLNAGYQSATVGECMGDPASNWYIQQ